ncbi:MAG: hypothetical protein A3K19_06785 [Lentisphaerae bacterium RIFOXYB12_FULL_65_16]|nr:MAG: hypothetical protein A3K18_21985 [Lentisphaerae bacterium RIFOXYA12_64_32]OGV93155.1 MAG: hypothetical protein A3K19_06785 [Lentisphaerae bacterium RIFOXYB12_FULL_65_16]
MSSASRHIFNRTELLVGKETMARLAATRVILLGVGGVGSWCAESLIRTGIGHLTMVDPDVICATNVNRQIQATTANVGKPKAEELRKRLLEVHPAADVVALKVRYDDNTCDGFDLASFDYVLDAIDTLSNKVLLIRRSLDAGVTLYSSMGAAVKFDPTQIRTAPINRTRNCPLARVVRRRLREQNETREFTCVYSEEPPGVNRGRTFCGSAVCVCPDKDEENLCLGKARINGTLAHVAATFGLVLAGLVIQDVCRRVPCTDSAAPPASAPSHAPPTA